MSQSEFETLNNILDIWRTVIQAIVFLVLWAAAFREKKTKRDGIAAVLFILANIGIGFLPCTAWVRYGVSASAIMGYAGICYKKQIGKAFFIILALYNFHCLGYLMANSIYQKIINAMLKSLDVMQDSYLQEMYRCMAVGMFCLVISYAILLAAMTLILCRLIKGVDNMAWQDVLLLSVLNFVGSMIVGVVNGLMAVKIDTEFFLLFDEKPDLLWKIPMIAVFIFAGEAALIYFWQRYRVLLSERQKAFVEEQQVKAMKKRLEEAENFYGSIRRVRH